MIERITIENFKSLRKVELKLGRFNLFIGTNASGKSNFFDALRALKGLAGGLSVPGLFDPAERTVPGSDWLAIRGDLGNLAFKSSAADESSVGGEVVVRARLGILPRQVMDYGITFSSDGRVTSESLVEGAKSVFRYDGHEACFHPENGRVFPCYGGTGVQGSEMVVGYLNGSAGELKGIVESWQRLCTGIQFLSLDPAALREYGLGSLVKRLRERGENFASIVKAICADPQTKSAYLTWLQELRPDEVSDVDTKPGAGNDVKFRLWEGGREFLASVLSEGTLRFAAIAAAFFQPELPPVLAVEEVDNGIHPTRLRLLVELLRSQAAQGKVQVLTTTHSPLVLAWLKPEEHATTFYCKRDEQTGESKICPLTEIPRFQDVIRQQSVADLFAEGWMEAAL